MSTALRVHSRTAAVAATAGNAVENTPVALNFDDATTALGFGAYSGATVRQTGGAAADTIAFRVYRDGSLKECIHSFAKTFSAIGVGEYANLGIEVPFFSGLWYTASAAAGAGRTVTMTPWIRAIA